MGSGGRALIQRPPSAGEEDGDRALVESTFSDAAQEQVTNAAGAPRPDHEQLRASGGHGAEEIAKRFAAHERSTRLPSATLELRSRTIERFRGRPRSNGIGPPDLACNRPGAGDAPLRGSRHQLHAGDKRDTSVSWRNQAAEECQRAPGGRRSVEADDDLAYTLRTPGDEHRTLGTTDDPSRYAAHEQAAHGAMTAPADP